MIGGNDLLFLGRRFAVRIGEPVTWGDLAAPGRRGGLGHAPRAGVRRERRIARRITVGLHARTAAAMVRAHGRRATSLGRSCVGPV